ncbi:MAG: pyridoxal 5'-phosphate synthase glutaminase subunit PdxT [Syntrophales bacterium]|nr:pyridoxal 5'-phosphate synthase glutaminase subunit PdxT [Syntrophales bacterium]
MVRDDSNRKVFLLKKQVSPSAIGVLDLQGGVFEHLDHLERLGITGTRVKEPQDFANLAGLIIPGGESTCLARLLDIYGIAEVITREFQRGMKIWGTCAGAILLAGRVVGESTCLGLIDIEIERNSFGSQLESFTCEASIPKVSPQPVPLTFIRAPRITEAGKGVEVLLLQDDYIAAAESPEVLVTVFHPELTGCLAFHRYFALKCGLEPFDDTKAPAIDPTWNNKSWTRFARTTDRG